MTEWLNFHFSLLCIGEGNGNPLQCSCLENPRDRRACWAAIYGVAKGWTQLKWLSSSSRSSSFSYSIQQQTISCLDCDAQWKEDFIWQPAMISSVAELRRSSKALPKAKLSPKKKVMVTVWWSAASLIHYSFLNPGETITSERYAQQIGEMYQKLWCLQLALVNRNDPVLFHNTWPHITQLTLQKLN